MKDLGFDEAISSRWESKRKDDAGVDICFTDPFNIQCKTLSKNVDYVKVLSEMPDDGNINVIFERRTEKRKTRFFRIGDYVHLELKDFLKLINGSK